MQDSITLAHCDSITDIKPYFNSHKDWICEPKLDGMRIQAVVNCGLVNMLTRSGKSANGKLPHVEEALGVYSWTKDCNFILDGEAVFFDEEGSPDFNVTMRVMGSGANKAVAKQEEWGKVSFMVFDIPSDDMRHLDLISRQKKLKEVVKAINSPYVKMIPSFEPNKHNLDDIIALYHEGAVLKRKTAKYGESKAWLKYKVELDADVVIMGYTEGTGKYEGMVGAIKFGQFYKGMLVERGQCSGMSDSERQDFTDNKDKYLGKVMVIHHYGFAAPDDDSGFRHPGFKYIRDDKSPKQCQWDLLDGTRI